MNSQNCQFGRLARLARDVLSVPVLVISLCDDERQMIVVRDGLPAEDDASVMPADMLCTAVLARGTALVSGRDADAASMLARLAERGHDFKAYLGMPIHLPTGEIAGVVGAADRRERTWSDEAIERLRSIAAILGEEVSLRLSETRWRILFEDMQECFYVAQAIRDGEGRLVDFRYLEVNPAFERMAGRQDAVGRTVRELLPDIAAQLVADYRSVVETGQAKLIESFTGNEWYEVRARALEEDRFAVTFQAIGERKRNERRLAEIEERRRLAIETGEVGILDLDLASRTAELDERGAGFCGLGDCLRVDLADLLSGVHPVDRPGLDRAFAPIFAGRTDTIAGQFRLTGLRDGVRRWLRMKAIVMRDAAGRPARLVGALRDVTDRMEADERRALLNAELSHRLKNTLAIVSSIVTQTLRSAPDLASARRALGDRIQALSKTHDILLSGQRDAACLEAILAAAISIHDEDGRVVQNGPPVAVGPKASLSLSLIVNELATNASKYGALSVPDGRILVHWRIETGQAADEPLLVFEWRERGGPPVTPPTRRSFGTRLVEMGLSGAPEAEATIDYAPDGLLCRIKAPLAEIATANEAEPN